MRSYGNLRHSSTVDRKRAPCSNHTHTRTGNSSQIEQLPLYLNLAYCNNMEHPDPIPSPASHHHCVMCGQDNPLSFGLRFKKETDGAVSATFTGNKNLQGYTGIMHGGVLSALLDTAMAQCLLHQNIEAVTGELNVRYLDQVDCQGTLSIRAWVDASLPPLYHLKSIISIDDKVVCKGKGRFMQRQAI